MGHLIVRDHSHCNKNAECVVDKKQPDELPPLAKSLLMAYIFAPEMRAMIAKCVDNGHTWYVELCTPARNSLGTHV